MTDLPETHRDTAPLDAPPASVTAGDLPSCCVATIGLHARYNPMMVCSECKQIIKCFTDVKPFRNYLVFCQSRRRAVIVGECDGYHVIIFRSYDNYR